MGSPGNFYGQAAKLRINGQSQKIDLSDLCGGKKVEGQSPIVILYNHRTVSFCFSFIEKQTRNLYFLMC
ncbi:hypothetical protein COJ96_04325 [Bacillus sp. AFS073361]|nr:hypothetical protein COJ96_04325 [Bacillus sp. AFS073361]